MAGIAVACGGYVVQCIGGADAERREALSTEISSMRQAILTRQRQVERQELKAKQRDDVQAARVWVSRQMMDIASLIPTNVTLSSLRLSERQIILAGVASKRSDVGELVSALRSDDHTMDVSVEILRDVGMQRQMFQEFVIRVVRKDLHVRGLSDARTEIGEVHRFSH
jgi:Tfp pilus assembly protein PilN